MPEFNKTSLTLSSEIHCPEKEPFVTGEDAAAAAVVEESLACSLAAFLSAFFFSFSSCVFITSGSLSFMALSMGDP